MWSSKVKVFFGGWLSLALLDEPQVSTLVYDQRMIMPDDARGAGENKQNEKQAKTSRERVSVRQCTCGMFVNTLFLAHLLQAGSPQKRSDSV